MISVKWIIIISIIILAFGIIFYVGRSKNYNIFLSTNDYKDLKILEKNANKIKLEIPKLDPSDKSIIVKPQEALNNTEGKIFLKKIQNYNNWLRGYMNGVEWYMYPIYYHGQVIGKSEQRFPETIKLIKSIPRIRIAAFSTLLPKAKMNIHTDDTGKSSGSLGANMLIEGENSYINIIKNGINSHKLQKNKFVIFDSNLPHYAENKSDKMRTILYLDIKTDN
jgi:aspartyl/asparaginyl beta-hydroxylase (cupin superfamily)